MSDVPEVGERVVLSGEVGRFPFAVVPEGTVGTVTRVTESVIHVTPDETVPGLEDWDGDLVWEDGVDTSSGETLVDVFRGQTEPLLAPRP